MADYKSTNNKSKKSAGERLPNQDAAAANTESVADNSRRDLLKGAGVLGAVMVGGSQSQIIAQESAPAAASREALEVLTAGEAETLEAICDALIPADDDGPGASEARAAHYIDRSLASHNKANRNDYLVSLAAINEHAQAKHGRDFSALNIASRNQVLQELQNGDVAACSPGSAGFFALVRSHTIDGTFCDPYYGGNKDFIGWDMLQYPGVRLSASVEEVALGTALPPSHESAYDQSSFTKRAMSKSGSND